MEPSTWADARRLIDGVSAIACGLSRPSLIASSVAVAIVAASPAHATASVASISTQFSWTNGNGDRQFQHIVHKSTVTGLPGSTIAFAEESVELSVAGTAGHCHASNSSAGHFGAAAARGVTILSITVNGFGVSNNFDNRVVHDDGFINFAATSQKANESLAKNIAPAIRS